LRPGAHRFEAEQKELFAAIERGCVRRLAQKEAEVAAKDIGERRVAFLLRNYVDAFAASAARSNATLHVHFAASPNSAE
jgi:hypothetical protein